MTQSVYIVCGDEGKADLSTFFQTFPTPVMKDIPGSWDQISIKACKVLMSHYFVRLSSQKTKSKKNSVTTIKQKHGLVVKHNKIDNQS